MKILNLYAGIGGNRKLWDDEHEITAVELREDIAAVYKDYFPNDNVIIGDAHKYLLDHYKEFDFIWSSRPCTTHSRANFWSSRNKDNRKKYFPDFGLYEEIYFLKYWFDGLWIVENVKPYYEPLIKPDYKIGRHIFWTNIALSYFNSTDADILKDDNTSLQNTHGFNLDNFKLSIRKQRALRNCVHPETGLHILNCALGKHQSQSAALELF